MDFEKKHQEDLQRLRGFRLLDDDFMTKVFEDISCAELLLRIILNDDFSCTDAKDMYNKVLADRVRYFKEDERGVEIMCREMEIMRNQAHEEGVEIGIKKGRMLQLIKQVCAKMQKFSSAEEIANDLVEQDVPLIQKIMDVAPNFGPDYNVDAIYKALNL